MGWVPYPAHMGPRFAGPITALRAFKKKKIEQRRGIGVPNRNLGQINRKQGVEAAASLRLGLRGSPFAPGVAGVGICACCALAPPN